MTGMGWFFGGLTAGKKMHLQRDGTMGTEEMPTADELVEKLLVIQEQYDENTEPLAYKVLSEAMDFLKACHCDGGLERDVEPEPEPDPDALAKTMFYASMARCHWNEITEAQQAVWRRQARRAVETQAERETNYIEPPKEGLFW
jgi:hypothetical protein